MKRMRRLLGAVFLALTLCGGWTTAGAAELDRGVLQVSQGWVRKGETVDVTFSLDGARDIQDGINVLMGTLTYNQAVFQPLTAADIAAAADWDDVYYNPDTGRLLVISRAGDRDGGEVFRFKLKANASLSPAETAIAFSEVQASEGQGDLQPDAAQVPVQVISDQVSSGGGNPPAAGNGDAAAENAGQPPRRPPPRRALPLWASTRCPRGTAPASSSPGASCC
ncbi:hypothetical protein [Subdoligranulum variabile]|nr:hypothetical protein [Subdoligranulum variabile]